ncbi:MAG TPA: ROK family protein [Gudongella oleilytica]|nr:ROK family protein [Gudongella oleilytica]
MKKAIGLDLGGTKINGALILEDGLFLKRASTNTRNEGDPSIILRQLAEMIAQLSEGEEVVGAGIGSPGFVDSENGRIMAVGGNIAGWAWTDVKAGLSDLSPLPVVMENDANCAAACEAWLGAGKDLSSFVMLTIGTGLGGAIWLPQLGLWRGSNFRAAELGHSILIPRGRKCTCGQYGCVERYASGTAIEENYFELSGCRIDGTSIVASYDVDEFARQSVDRFARDLGIFLATLRNIIDPEAFIIGGGVIDSRTIWWDTMINEFKNQVNDPSSIEILPAQYGNDAGMLGAASLVFDNPLDR